LSLKQSFIKPGTFGDMYFWRSCIDKHILGCFGTTEMPPIRVAFLLAVVSTKIIKPPQEAGARSWCSLNATPLFEANSHNIVSPPFQLLIDQTLPAHHFPLYGICKGFRIYSSVQPLKRLPVSILKESAGKSCNTLRGKKPFTN
jgi:hypothetical protein